jgi:hypothetical protein
MADETLEARALRFQADNIDLRAQIAVLERANAERLAAAMSLDNPDRNFQLLDEACFLVGYDTESERKKVWGWLRRGLIYGYKIPGTCHSKVCANDLRDKIDRTGRHG